MRYSHKVHKILNTYGTEYSTDGRTPAHVLSPWRMLAHLRITYASPCGAGIGYKRYNVYDLALLDDFTVYMKARKDVVRKETHNVWMKLDVDPEVASYNFCQLLEADWENDDNLIGWTLSYKKEPTLDVINQIKVAALCSNLGD